MRKTMLSIVLSALLPIQLSAQTFQCVGTDSVIKTDDPYLADLTCDAAQRAQVFLARCGIPDISRPLTVKIVDRLVAGGVGQYQRGSDLIEVLSPPMMEAMNGTDSSFAFLPGEAYFESVVVHELTHAALDDMSCPFEACLVAREYIAYGMQVMSLSADHQATFSANADLGRPISRDELSVVILFMAPQIFAKKSWMHLSQRDDPCAFVGQIVDGTVLLDREHFHN